MAKKAALAIRSGLFLRYTTLGSLVVVSSGTVDVTVVHLFGGGVAHFEHFDGKVQSFAGERVVGGLRVGAHEVEHARPQGLTERRDAELRRVEPVALNLRRPHPSTASGA